MSEFLIKYNFDFIVIITVNNVLLEEITFQRLLMFYYISPRVKCLDQSYIAA
jgi:hypothetical protein